MSRYTDIDFGNKRLSPVGGYWSEDLVSLEEALKPIESLINELNRSIKTAKKHCKFPSEHGLTRDESASIYLYTMEGGKNSFYKVLNEALRSENRPALKPWFPFLKLFEVALKKLPKVKENIWRGANVDVRGQFKSGQILTWWGISSCSKSLGVVQGFLSSDTSSTVFMIEAVNGKDVEGYTYFPSENEVILGLGTELRVKGDTLKHHGGLNIIHLVELSDDDVEELPKAVAKMDLKPEISVKGAAKSSDEEEIHPVTSTRYSDESVPEISYHRTTPVNTKKRDDVVTIGVHCLVLNENCSVFDDKNCEKVFVGVDFLDYPPEELETPYALVKGVPNTKYSFNFQKNYFIHDQQKKQQLLDLIGPQSSGEIKFMVVAEPPEDQPTLDCVDIGYATVNAKQLLRNEHDFIEKIIDVHGMNEENQVIGQMNVTVSIVQALKSVQNNRQMHS